MTTRRTADGAAIDTSEPEEDLDVQQPHGLESDSSEPDSDDEGLQLEVEARMDELFATDEDEDDEYEMDEDEEEDEELSEPETRAGWFSYRSTTPPRELLSQLRKLPVPLEPLCCDLSQQLNLDTAGMNTRGPRLPGSVDIGRDPVQSISAFRAKQHGAKRARSGSIDPPASSSRPRTRSQRNSLDTSDSGATDQAHGTSSTAAAASCPKRAASQGAASQVSDDAAGAGPSSAQHLPDSGFRVLNTAKLLLKREVALGSVSGFSRQQQRHLSCYRNMPNTPTEVMDAMPTRAYIGQYSSDGKFFVAAYQDRRVRLYDCNNKWALRKDVTTRMTRWTITDTTLSPDQRFLVYASITPVAYLVHVGSNLDVVESMANVTDLHDPLPFDNVRVGDDEQELGRPWQARRFGIWSIAWSPAGGEIIAGTNDEAVYVYDIQAGRSHIKLADHKDDVNAVTYVDGGAGQGGGNIIASGSDDRLVRIWDRRMAGATCRVPVGIFVGHTEGVTHIDARGDDRHLISNSKDQTIKMWDMRKGLLSQQEVQALPHKRVPAFHWDYRMDEFPGAGYEVRHPHDQSLATYRGHKVTQTLIRAYFSPAFSTGQRFIYSGSSAGDVNVWDAVTTKQVARLKHHRAPVRDVSWHPTEPELVSTSWDGSIVRWAAKGLGDDEGGATRRLPVQREDAAHYY